MHFNATDGRYHEALRRLAVVLLMLAGIADRAACRSWPMRSLLLWLLGRAEMRVCGFAEKAGALPLISGGYPACLSGGPNEAARLAKTFRALAATFLALARKMPQWLRMARRWRCRMPGGLNMIPRDGHNGGRLGRPIVVSRLSGAWQRSYADTS
jgi:hypothetical protein